VPGHGEQAPAASRAASPAAPAPTAVDHSIKVLPGFAWDLFAAEPLVADPVSFAIDEQGRIFVMESERQERGVEDNRHCTWWLLDDLSNQTVDDRLRMYEKWATKFDGGMEHFTRWADRVRVLVDPDEHGRPTRAVNFSGDMRDPLDGTGAGVLVRDGEVWCTNIPNLWRFRDTNDDGVADERDRVFSGFGVRIALRGHDMHGLIFGPDGRLYWSIGDRGYHLTLADGRVLADPKSGAVFRCDPDGSNLEIYCTGLRNPQELAFNRFGDLFTGDNNSDAGDKARIVWCVDGGETGWDMNYQTLEGANQRGPWNQERIWTTWTESDVVDPLRAAWTLPPLAHVSSGPSGLVAYPGVGFDDRYRDSFFLCDFLGDARASRVLAFRATRDGAGYQVSDVHPFVSEVLPTDVDFDYAGRLVISDWDATWESNGKGQIYRVWDPRFIDSPEVKQVTEIMRDGVAGLTDGALGRLLVNADMRVRLRAQWELAKRSPKSTALFAAIARGDADAARAAGAELEAIPLEAQLHAIWGLGQQLRAAERGVFETAITASEPSIDGAKIPTGERFRAFQAAVAEIGALLLPLLEDEDAEVRTQTARVLGEAAYAPALEALITLATEEDPRVRMAAATALGRIGSKDAIPALVAILWENEDQNPYLRHAASLALARIGDREKLLELSADQFPQVRMGAVLALRRLGDPALARSLFDPERRIATEAARAIHDLPIADARPALVALAERWAASADPALLAAPATAAEGPAPFRRDLWRQMHNAMTIDLLTHPVFDRKPMESLEIAEFAGPRDDGNLYVERLSGFYVAPQDGAYRFAVAADDRAVVLFKSDSERSPRVIAQLETYVQPGHYDARPEQQSAPIELKKGDRCWIEARHGQGGGASHCSVRVTRPDGTIEDPIGHLPQPNLDAVPLLRRAIDECVRDGSARAAEALLGIASNSEVPLVMRSEALESLRIFADPVARRPSLSGDGVVPTDPPIMRDRVNGHVRPVDLAARDLEGYRRVLSTRLPDLASRGPAELRALARTIAEEQNISLDPAAALATLRDPSAGARERAQCLAQLVRQGHPELDSLIAMALSSDAPLLRMAAREALARTEPARAVSELRSALLEGSLVEQQAAIASLPRLERADADAVLVQALEAAPAVRNVTADAASSAPVPTHPHAGAPATALDLDLFDAVTRRASASPALATALARWREGRASEGAALYMELALEGGDAERGREIVNFHSAAACLRCHVLDGHGGNASPALDGVGARLSRAELLRSLVDPNAAIAENYTAPSSMPEVTTLLTPREARDVVEYLSTLR